MKRIWLITFGGVLLCLGAALAFQYKPWNSGRKVRATAGNPKAGRKVLVQYGCTACHSIPGISETGDITAPSLAHIGNRQTLAGIVPNTPENMVEWIQSPSRLKAGTSMPGMNVPEKQARDIAAFLYTLR